MCDPSAVVVEGTPIMVKCIDCRFLVVRDWARPDLAAAGGELRRKLLAAPPGSKLHAHQRTPVCLAGSTDLRDELLGPVVHDPSCEPMLDAAWSRLLLDVLNRERPACNASGAFASWEHGRPGRN